MTTIETGDIKTIEWKQEMVVVLSVVEGGWAEALTPNLAPNIPADER